MDVELEVFEMGKTNFFWRLPRYGHSASETFDRALNINLKLLNAPALLS